MIFRKPYAFLIKNFKILHFILLAIVLYITYRFNILVRFFNNYVRNNNIISEGLEKNYLPISIFLLIIVLIIISGLLWLLMYRKKKPNTFYLLTGIYYSIVFISFTIAYNLIKDLSIASITQQSALAYRDIYLLLYLPNFYFITINFIRGIGFDIKKFNFKQDLKELEIKSEDNEEFEFVLGNDNYKIQRKFRRYFREFKYYLKENKIYISIIIIALFIITSVTIFLNVTFFNHVYTINETLKTRDFTYTLNHAYLSSRDYSGKIINDNKTYLILDFTIKSNYDTKKIEPENFYLKYNNKVINYKTTLRTSFFDLGNVYQNDKIPNNKTSYLFIFELEKNAKSKYELNIFDKITYKNDKANYEYKKYKISPKELDNTISTDIKNIKDELKLSNGSLTINNVQITSNYEYKYQECINDVCNEKISIELPENSINNNLLVIDYNLNINDNNFKISDKQLFSRFLKISYTKNNQEYYYNASIKSIDNLENVIIFEIPKYISKENNAKININTRTNNYSIEL